MEDQIDYAISYPELSEEGRAKTKEIIGTFSKQLQELFNNTLYSFTCNISEEIVDDDSWTQIRQNTLHALCGYSEAERRNKADGTYLGQWWVTIRKKILEENREAIVNDIILDKEAEIRRLEERINIIMQDRNRY